MTSTYPAASHRTAVTRDIRASAVRRPTSVPPRLALAAITRVSARPAAKTSAYSKKIDTLVVEAERLRLSLEPLAEDFLPTPARRNARAVEVVEEVVDPVDPLLVAERHHDAARLLGERLQHVERLVLLGREIEGGDVVGDGVRLLLEHCLDGGDRLVETQDLGV